MNIIRKGQVRWMSGSGVRRQDRFINELFEVAVSFRGTTLLCDLLFRSETCNTASSRFSPLSGRGQLWQAS